MKKVFNFGKIDYNKTGRNVNLVTVEMELKENNDSLPIFSVRGNIWNHIKSDIYSGGQNLDTIKKYVKSKLFLEIFRLWKLYHLNNRHAGTLEQEQALDEWLKTNKYDYNKACDYLKSIGKYEVMHNNKPYKYGHGWIYFPIPDNDLAIIKNLLS